MPLNPHKLRRNSNAACYECGIKSTKQTYKLPSSPFRLQNLHPESEHAYKAAKRVVEEGEAKIAELEKAIKRLRARKQQIGRITDEHRPLLTLVHRLPDEVLLLLFEEVSGCSRDEELDCLSEVNPPWTISAVCQRWRRVALSSACSHLWAQLYLEGIFSKKHSELLSRLQSLHIQVSRAGSTPLRVFLSIPETVDGTPSAIESPAVRTAIRSLLATVLPNCCNLVLGGDVPEDWCILPDNAPTLQLAKLAELTVFRETWLLGQHRRIIRHSAPPVLKTLTLSAMDLLSQDVPVSWFRHLTNLVLEECLTTARDVLDVLKVTTKLEGLCIERIIWHAEDGDQLAHLASQLRTDVGEIQLPSLKSVILGLNYPNPENIPIPRGIGMVELLQNHLRAPALTELTLNDVYTQHDLDAVRDFVAASGVESRLTKFSLHKPIGGDSDNLCRGIVALLGHLPYLEELRLSTCIAEGAQATLNIDEVLMALKWPTSDEDHSSATTAISSSADHRTNLLSMKICPKLEVFETHAMVMDSSILRSMLHSRVRDPDIPASPRLPWQLEYVSIRNPTLTDEPEVVSQGISGATVHLPWLLKMEEKGWCRSDDDKRRMFPRDIQPVLC